MMSSMEEKDGGEGRRMGRRLVGGILGGLGAIAGGMLNGGDLMRYVSTEGVEMVGSSVAMAGTLYKNKNVADKLAQVPVFLVTNATGQPYLANMEESHQVGLIFFSPKDAEKAWEQMKASPGADDAKIFPMSLDRAMEMVKAKPTPSGLRNESGQDLLMVFRLYPDTEQVSEERWSRKQQPCRSWFLTYVLLRRLCPCFLGGGWIKVRNAGKVLGRRSAAASQVPVFAVRGLVVKKGREFVQPLFLSKEDLEKNWERVRAENPKLPRKPNIEVYGLQEILEGMEKGEEALRDWGFYPASYSVAFMKQQKEIKQGNAKMHMNPLLGD